MCDDSRFSHSFFPPDQLEIVQVSKEKFYDLVCDNTADSFPSTEAELRDWEGRLLGYRSVWKSRDGRIFGYDIMYSTPHDGHNKYFVRKDILKP